MQYERIARYVADTPWAIIPSKADEITNILAFRAAGHAFTPAEIRARLGGDERPRAQPTTRGAVAIVPLRGVIAHRIGSMDDSSGGTSCERFTAVFRQALANDAVGTIVIDLDSPGGTVIGVSELAAEIFAGRARKRIITHINGIGGSAGYWLGAQAHEIHITPSGSAGSIGVFMVHEDLSRKLEKEGVSVSMISAGKYKTEGNPFAPLSAEAKAHRQRIVDNAYAQFVGDVARGRGVSASAVRAGYGEGRMEMAEDALRLGMVDRIVTFDASIAQLTSGRALPPARGVAAMHARAGDDEELRRRFSLL